MTKKMTKKDFELIAGIIKKNNIYFDNPIRFYLFCRAFGMLLSDKYKRFDDIKFLKACGIEQ